MTGLPNGPVDDETDEALAAEYERHRTELYDRIADYMEEADLPAGAVAEIVADIAVSMCMTAYAFDVDKPSVAGVRMELERFGQDIGGMIRDAKKGAEEFITEAKAAIAEAESDEAAKS